MAEGARLVQQDVRLLDRPLEEISNKVQWPCSNCSEDLLPNVLDNARVPCHLEVWQEDSDQPSQSHTVDVDMTSVTARQVFDHNQQRKRRRLDVEQGNPQRLGDAPRQHWYLHVKCRSCNGLVDTIRPTDTPEKLHKDLRAYITNDKSLPLTFDSSTNHPDIPDGAWRACELAHRFPAEQKITEGLIIRIQNSLRHGQLWQRLREKMDDKSRHDENLRRLTYLRVGVGMKALRETTAVLELWPAGHSSPKHQHGGCSGSVRVLHGVLDVKLYENLFEEQPIKWQNGDGGLEHPQGVRMETLQLAAGVTTWMDRANWFVHEVACNRQDERNRHGFAMSLHVYISCTDEFYMLSRPAHRLAPSAGSSASSSSTPGATTVERRGFAKRGNPTNDFFWNLDLPDDDRRVQEMRDGEVLDFMQALEERQEEDSAHEVDTSRFEPIVDELIAGGKVHIDDLGNIRHIDISRNDVQDIFRRDIDALLLAIARKASSRRTVIPREVSTSCCRGLETLELWDFQHVTDQGLRWLLGLRASGCIRLSTLSLFGCSQVTDEALRHIAGAQGCRRLTTLDLRDCAQVTDTGLRQLAGGQGCPQLLILDLRGCAQVTDTGLRQLAGAQGAQLFATSIDEETCLKYIDRFLMFYCSTAKHLQRTAPWLEELPGGIEYLKKVVIEDSLGICADLEAMMKRNMEAYKCEWKEVVYDEELQKKFQQFVNTSETQDTEQLEYVDRRKQRHPATYDLPDIKGPALYSKEKADEAWQWYPAGKVQDFPHSGGLAMKHGDHEVAVFNLSHRADDSEKWFATQNLCPFKQVRVISRGLVGQPPSGGVTILDPVYKTSYDLKTGQGITSPDLNLSTFQTRVTAEGAVEVKLPPPGEYSAALQDQVKKAVEESGVKAAKALGKSKPFDGNGKHIALDW